MKVDNFLQCMLVAYGCSRIVLMDADKNKIIYKATALQILFTWN